MMNTKWLGLDLKNPFVPSASPLTRSLDAAKQLEDAGAGALIMYSLFEEEIRGEAESMVRFLHHQDHGHSEAVDFLPDKVDFPSMTDRYLEQIASLKATLDIPIVASLNGISNSGWLEHAIEIEDAGADALELNVYYVAASPWEESSEVENRYIELLKALKEDINIPINMKLSPFFSSISNMVKRLESAGVEGVSLFNRFYQPDINIHNMSLQPSLHPSTSADSLLAMRWIAMLHKRVECSLGATGGVHTSEDAIRLLLAGADVIHLATSLLQKGPECLAGMITDLEEWMEEQNFETLGEFRGRVSQMSVVDTAAFERVNYIRVLDNYSLETGGQD